MRAAAIWYSDEGPIEVTIDVIGETANDHVFVCFEITDDAIDDEQENSICHFHMTLKEALELAKTLKKIGEYM
jgi:hypothetical protein